MHLFVINQGYLPHQIVVANNSNAIRNALQYQKSRIGELKKEKRKFWYEDRIDRFKRVIKDFERSMSRSKVLMTTLIMILIGAGMYLILYKTSIGASTLDYLNSWVFPITRQNELEIAEQARQAVASELVKVANNEAATSALGQAWEFVRESLPEAPQSTADAARRTLSFARNIPGQVLGGVLGEVAYQVGNIGSIAWERASPTQVQEVAANTVSALRELATVPINLENVLNWEIDLSLASDPSIWYGIWAYRIALFSTGTGIGLIALSAIHTYSSVILDDKYDARFRVHDISRQWNRFMITGTNIFQWFFFFSGTLAGIGTAIRIARGALLWASIGGSVFPLGSIIGYTTGLPRIITSMFRLPRFGGARRFELATEPDLESNVNLLRQTAEEEEPRNVFKNNLVELISTSEQRQQQPAQTIIIVGEKGVQIHQEEKKSVLAIEGTRKKTEEERIFEIYMERGEEEDEILPDSDEYDPEEEEETSIVPSGTPRGPIAPKALPAPAKTRKKKKKKKETRMEEVDMRIF